MKICDVVLNSVWHDPRVRKQIAEYLKYNVDLVCVGMKDKRFDEKQVAAIPCHTVLVERDAVFGGTQKLVIKKIIRELYRIYLAARAICEQKPDLIHANDLDALIPAFIASRFIKCRLVFDAHEINCSNRYYDKYKLYDWAMSKIERYIVKRCDLMVCVSNAAAEYYEKHYNMKKPLVVTNCVLQHEIIWKEPEKHNGFEVLNHGMYRDARGFELMIDSCDYFKDYPEIILAARGLGPLEDTFRENAIKQKTKNFLFYPPAHPTELIQQASASHVGVAITLPVCLNYVMSVSNRLFEYVAAGLPVIMSDIPEHRMINDKYHIGLIIPDNTPAEFAKAVIRLYEDREFYTACKNNTRKLNEEIVWEKEFKKLFDAECMCVEVNL